MQQLRLTSGEALLPEESACFTANYRHVAIVGVNRASRQWEESAVGEVVIAKPTDR